MGAELSIPDLVADDTPQIIDVKLSKTSKFEDIIHKFKENKYNNDRMERRLVLLMEQVIEVFQQKKCIPVGNEDIKWQNVCVWFIFIMIKRTDTGTSIGEEQQWRKVDSLALMGEFCKRLDPKRIYEPKKVTYNITVVCEPYISDCKDPVLKTHHGEFGPSLDTKLGESVTWANNKELDNLFDLLPLSKPDKRLTDNFDWLVRILNIRSNELYTVDNMIWWYWLDFESLCEKLDPKGEYKKLKYGFSKGRKTQSRIWKGRRVEQCG